MTIRKLIKKRLAQFPLLDGLFRRFVWSRVHFSEVEMEFLNSLPKGTIDVAIDVGAALGAYAWILNRKANYVYAFEPGKVHNDYLRKAAIGTNIQVIRAAVGSVSGKMKMYTPGEDTNARHSATLSQHNPVVNSREVVVDEVDVVMLDDYLKGKLSDDRSIDLVKVDVEGFELDVFRGASNILDKYHPLVICEIEARHNEQYGLVFEFLREHGYSCYISQDGEFKALIDDKIENIQCANDLVVRLGSDYKPEENRYINNFVFQHSKSHVKVAE